MPNENENQTQQKKHVGAVQAQRPRRGPGGGGMVGSGEKATDFMGTLKRLLGMLRKDIFTLILIVIFAAAAVACTISVPRVMENAVNSIYSYVVQSMTYSMTHPEAQKIQSEVNSGFASAEKTLNDKLAQATAGQIALAEKEAQIAKLPATQQAAAQAQLAPQKARVEEGLAAITAGKQQLEAARSQVEEKFKALKTAKSDSVRLSTVKSLGATMSNIPLTGSNNSSQSAQIAKFKSMTDSQMIGLAKGFAPKPKMNYSYIGKIGLIMLAIVLFSSVLSALQQRMTVRVTQELVRRLRRQVSEKLDRLPLKFFDGQTHGEILSKLTIDIDLMSTNLQNVMSQSMTSVLMLVGIIIMMFTVNWLLALVSCIVLPLAFIATAIIAPKAQRYFGRQQNQLGELNGQIEENYGGHNIIKAFNREKISINTFKDTNEVVYDSAWKAQFLSSLLWPVVIFAVNLQYVVIVVLAAILTRSKVFFLGANIGGMTVGGISAFILYLNQFQQPMTQIAQIANVIQSSMAAAERVFILLDEKEEAPDPLEAPEVENPQGAVQVADINFDYDPSVPLIRDWNMMTEPGKMVAIVGPTGAGKTTIVNLLMRFYEVNSGTITVDGVDTSIMRRADVRKLFGMVLQDTWLYSGTIRENIAYGKDDATEDEIIQAADTALADHFIRTLPHGYDTEIQEDANNLSAGQRQLLTIARAFLADAPILILDEATSSVDTRTEQLIQAAMERLMHGRTSFVIAHRLSTIRNADQILVMNHGRIVESGNHDQLLAANGFYADLYNSQFAGDEDA
ncbi:MAG: ABC transporter ATP-binding protein/permease [Coriobacteriia bacterium]|nr:ABC transporter ATP-binding protein/permease [Coriobacteriia bacterium]